MKLNNTCVALLTVLLVGLVAVPGSTEEIIHSYHSEIIVKKDATVNVTETIEVQAEGNDIRRGIYRDFPTEYTDKYGRQHSVDFEIQAVRRDGQPEPYHTESIDRGVRVYIGKKDRFIDPGRYRYEINYDVNWALGYFDNHDELYWNVTGNNWKFPIKQATATVRLPKEVSPDQMQVDGYTGYEGSSNQNYEILEQSPGEVSIAANRSLAPNQGLTIAVGWPKGIVNEPSTKEKSWHFINDNLRLLVGVFGTLLVLVYYLFSWLRVGVDPEKGTIIPRYEPPEGISPAAARYVNQMGYDDETFTAALVNLAVNGYVNIKEEGGDFTVTLKKEVDGSRPAGEQALAEELFSSGDTIEFKQDNHETINDAMESLEDELEDGYHREFFFTNTGYLVGGVLLSLFVFGGMVYTSSLNMSEDLLFLVFWLVIWTAGTSGLIKKTYTTWSRYFRTRGAKSLFSAVTLGLFSLPFIAAEIVVIGLVAYMGGLSLVLITGLLLGVNILFYILLKAPTVQGRKLMDKIQGFKRYMNVAEKERLDIEELPERTPELYERLLPYAMALGVAHQWTDSFTDVLRQAGEAGTGYRPHWYHGHFTNHHALSSRLSGSLSSSIATSSSPPSSSSGVGGGGISGGGVGGGGGGGW